MTEKERLDALVKATRRQLEVPTPNPTPPGEVAAAEAMEEARRASRRFPPRR